MSASLTVPVSRFRHVAIPQLRHGNILRIARCNRPGRPVGHRATAVGAIGGQGRGVGYAIKVPFYRWLDLQRYIRDSPTWLPMAPGVTGFAVPGAETPWHIPVTVTIYRKTVHHRATKNYQLDLCDPNDGHYEYSAVTSHLALTVRNLWYFACGRGNHEKTSAQLKTGLAFHSVPTQTYAANSAWQQLVVLAHNLLTNFQLETGAPPRRRTRKHTVVPLLQSVQTLRFELFHRPPCWSAPVARRGCG